jgi:hypothetical protein
MSLFKQLFLASSFILVSGCDSSKETLEPNNGEIILNTLLWDFNSLNGWEDASQNMNNVINYTIVGANLRFFTNPNTYERPKVKTIAKFNRGRYSWRVYASEMGVGDMTSIGAFLYHDDEHELDFEIGYGSQAKRTELGAQNDDLIVYMTSQGFPYYSYQKKIKRNKWYTLTIDLLGEVNSNYNAIWKIDGVTESTLALNYNSEIDFSIFCSLENLQFIGDHPASIQNYTLFDYVKFEN